MFLYQGKKLLRCLCLTSPYLETILYRVGKVKSTRKMS